jgi:hypothetical protein
MIETPLNIRLELTVIGRRQRYQEDTVLRKILAAELHG